MLDNQSMTTAGTTNNALADSSVADNCTLNLTTPQAAAQEKIQVERIGKVKRKPFFAFVKRSFDFISSFLALVVFCLPMLIVAIVIKCDSKGPVIYKQERLGLNGKPFMLYKFRSMRADAEACSGAKWADKNDDRVTRVGKFMRKTRIDELPQLFNIFSGKMSIIGPRPERKIFYDQFAEYIDGFEERLKVKPGLSGLAQVSGGYDLKPEEKIVYDIEYIKKRSIWMDIKIIFKTIAVVFSHDGAR